MASTEKSEKPVAPTNAEEAHKEMEEFVTRTVSEKEFMENLLKEVRNMEKGLGPRAVFEAENDCNTALDNIERRIAIQAKYVQLYGQEFKKYVFDIKSMTELSGKVLLALNKRKKFLKESGVQDPQQSELRIKELEKKIAELSLQKSGDNKVEDLSMYKQKCDMTFPKFKPNFTKEAVAYADWREMVNTYMQSFPQLKETFLMTKLKESTVDVEAARLITQNYRPQDAGVVASALEALDKRFRCRRLIMMQTLDRIINLTEEVKKKRGNEKLQEIVDCITNNLQPALNHVKQELIDGGNENPTQDEIDLQLVKQWKSCLVLRALDENTTSRLLSQMSIKTDIMPEFDEVMQALNVLVSASYSTKKPIQGYAHMAEAECNWAVDYPEQCPICTPTSNPQAHWHTLDECRVFIGMPVPKRWEKIKETNFCKICLQEGFRGNSCRKSGRTCMICEKPHHELLCSKAKKPETHSYAGELGKKKGPKKGKGKNKKQNPQNPQPQQPQNQQMQAPIVHQAECHTSVVSSAQCTEGWCIPLLSTAQVKIQGEQNKWNSTRSFLDEGAMISGILESDVRRFNLPTKNEPMNIVGFNKATGEKTEKVCYINLTARDGIKAKKPLPLQLKCVVMKHLPKSLPSSLVRRDHEFEKVNRIVLADEEWDTPGPVTILLGTVDVNRIKTGKIIRNGETMYEETQLGWIVRGGAPEMTSYGACFETDEEPQNDGQLQLNLEKFFDYGDSKAEPEELDRAEKIFQEKTYVEKDGTYVVPFPWVENVKLGESRSQCLARNRRTIERVNPEIKSKMYSVMRSYIEKKIWVKSNTNVKGHYNPITIVHKPESITTPVRICMDASARSSNGKSLNDNMLAGPKLQPDIDRQIQKLRIQKIGVCADVRSMYLNAKMLPTDQVYQRTVVIWENGKQEDFDMATIVFGTKAAPYLANRVFKDIAKNNEKTHPLGSKVLNTRTYIDDINDSYETVEIGKETIRQLLEITKKHNFPVVKWASNNPEVLRDIPIEDTLSGMEIPEKDKTSVKVLGLKWNLQSDTLKINCKGVSPKTFTKREVASCIATIYDPCGFLAPVTLSAKAILQELWKTEKGLTQDEKSKTWDQNLPKDLNEKFTRWAEKLNLLDDVKIPRHVGIEKNAEVELVTYVDASNTGYGAVTYIRVHTKDGLKTTIVQAKNHVAALSNNYFPSRKPELSIPRLEMLAAVQGAMLAEKVRANLELPEDTKKIFFSDSMVVLGQIYGPENRRTQWVERRLRKIRRYSSPSQWYHIPGEENICADSLSRGLNPEDFQKILETWIHGPKNMQETVMKLPKQNITSDLELVGKKQLICQIMVSEKLPENHVLEKLSEQKTFTKAKRVLATMLKMVEKFRAKKENRPFSAELKAQDIKRAEVRYIKMAQEVYFGEIIEKLEEKQEAVGDLKLKSPFLDSNGILRLYTRLQNVNEYDYANPIVLPPLSQKAMMETEKVGKFPIIRQIVHEAHLMTLHGGPSEMTAYVNQRYWLRNMRNTIRMICHRCLVCAKARATPGKQLMGSVPEERLERFQPPFSNIILDYAGPFEIKQTYRRSKRKAESNPEKWKDKAYVAVIVCQVTNAVFLDVVEDATAEAFLKCFTRFTNTRGTPRRVRSDNASTFVKAAKILEAKNEKQAKALGIKKIQDHCANWQIEWNFNPPRSPHYGGHAEVFVKMTKNKLQKALMAGRLNIVDLITTLKKIEGALNSRPIVSVGSKFEGGGFLTPSHFIMGRPTVEVPPGLAEPSGSKPLKEMFRVQEQIIKNFWKIHKQYFQHLASRAKWGSKQPNIAINDLVLILEDDYSKPLTWKTGIVIETHPGRDGLVRVVTVRTSSGSLRRSVNRVAKLPVES